MKYISIYIIFLFTLSCDALIEQRSPLEGDFYIQDGWIAFEASEFNEAIDFFKISTEIDNDTNHVIHFLSNIGIGWAKLYKSKYLNNEESNNLIDSAGYHFDLAHSLLDTVKYIMLNIDQEEINENLDIMYHEGISNMYSGLTIQRNYAAKEMAVDIINSESDSIVSKYEQSILFSQNLDQSYIFQYDENITFKEILVLRIETLIILDQFEEAITNYNELIELETNLEIDDKCQNGISSQNLVECLCIISYDGSCPFDG